MATAQIRPDWTIGTLNLTAGVVEFTTTDSLLETAAIQAGDSLITESGLVLIIADITGQNSGTLMEPCPAGAAGIGQPLRVRFQPDGSRYNGAVADMVQLLGSGNVYEFAGLVGEVGKSPVFTGLGTMGLGDTYSDPNGNLGDLAALELSARQVLQTDENGVLKTVALAADKLLHTDDNGDVAQSDLTAEALAMLASSTPVISSLGYTPLNRAGDDVQASLGIADDLYMHGGSIILPPPTGQVYALSSTTSVTVGAGAPFIAHNFAGLMIVTNTTVGGTAMILCGGGSIALVFNAGNPQIGNYLWATNENGYAFFNTGASAANYSVMLLRTRAGA